MKDIKLKNRKNKVSRSNVILLSVIVLFLFIGIGFAYIRSSLSITGNSTIAGGVWDVHFANISAIYPTNSDNNFSYNMEEHEITFSFRFVDIDESYQFEVDVVNNGKLDAMISGLEVLGITDDYKDYLNYSITYSDDAIIRENDLLASNTTERIKIMFSFNKEANINKLSTDGNISLTIKLPYIQATEVCQERLHSQGLLLNRIKEANNWIVDSALDFTSTEQAGLPGYYIRLGTEEKNEEYKGEPIYYYRGSIAENNVIFANMCWQIVRTTETGGLKLLYKGLPTDGKCTTVDSGVSMVFNSSTDSYSYVGYMYNLDISEKTSDAMIAAGKTSLEINKIDSNIKKNVDIWYKKNIDDKGYTSMLEDAVWCNDRSQDKLLSSTSSTTYYGSYQRNRSQTTGSTVDSHYVTDLKACPNWVDRFTVNDTMKGNGALTYPVGLLTADEVSLAGGGFVGKNSSAWIFGDFWTMSPRDSSSSRANNWDLAGSGLRDYSYSVNFRSYMRPAISIKGSTIYYNGDGTKENPYIVTP